MAKKWIKKFMPDHKKIRDHKYLKIFGRLLHDPNLWHLNRRSVSGAFGIGVFFAFVPVPFQMVLAAAAAIPLRMNLPISVALVWISNPITIPPMLVGVYLLGAWIMNVPVVDLGAAFEAQKWTDAISMLWGQIWQPILLGCAISGVVFSFLAYMSIRWLWRWHVIREWEARKAKRSAAAQQD